MNAMAAMPPTTLPATAPLVEEENREVVPFDELKVASALLASDIATVEKVDMVPVEIGVTTTPMMLTPVGRVDAQF